MSRRKVKNYFNNLDISGLANFKTSLFLNNLLARQAVEYLNINRDYLMLLCDKEITKRIDQGTPKLKSMFIHPFVRVMTKSDVEKLTRDIRNHNQQKAAPMEKTIHPNIKIRFANTVNFTDFLEINKLHINIQESEDGKFTAHVENSTLRIKGSLDHDAIGVGINPIDALNKLVQCINQYNRLHVRATDISGTKEYVLPRLTQNVSAL